MWWVGRGLCLESGLGLLRWQWTPSKHALGQETWEMTRRYEKVCTPPPAPPHESQALRDEEWTLSTPAYRSQRPQGYHNDLGMSADSRISKKCLNDRVEESAATPLLPRT